MKLTALGLMLIAGSVAVGQDDPAVVSAAALLEQLRAAGVEIPDGFSVNDDGSVSVPAPPAEAEAVEIAADAGDAGEPSLPVAKRADWDTKLNIGLNVASGNTEQTGFAATIISKRSTESSVLTLDAGYFNATQDGDQTANRFTSGVNHDWLLPDSRWLYFAGGRYDFDDFRSFDHRISLNTGVGYEIIKREKMQLTLRVGISAYQEYGSRRNEIVPEALLGADFNWDYADNQSFFATTRIYPSIADGGEFRSYSTAGWKLDIDKNNGLSFSINAIHEYISDVDPGIEKSDLQLFAGLTYGF